LEEKESEGISSVEVLKVSINTWSLIRQIRQPRSSRTKWDTDTDTHGPLCRALDKLLEGSARVRPERRLAAVSPISSRGDQNGSS